MSSRLPITRAEANQILAAPLVDAIDLMNQFSLQDETPSESVPTEPVRLEAVFRVDSTTTSTNKTLQNILWKLVMKTGRIGTHS